MPESTFDNYATSAADSMRGAGGKIVAVVIAASIVREAPAIASAVARGVTSGVASVASVVASGTATATRTVGTAMATGIRAVATGATRALATVVSGIGPAFRFVGTALTGLVSAVGGGFRLIRQGISALIAAPQVFIAVAAASILGAVPVLGMLGRGIHAAVGLASSVIGKIGSVIAPLWGGVVATVARITAWGRNAFGVVTSALGGMFRGIAGFLGNVWKGVVAGFGGVSGGGAVGAFVASIVSGARGVISSMFALSSGLLKIGLALGAVGLFATAVKGAADAALAFAKSAAVLSAKTGFSLSKSGGILQNFKSVGLGADTATAAAGQNPYIANIMSKFWKLPMPSSDDFISKFADKFQGLMRKGFVGQMQAGVMASQMGMDSPDALSRAMMDPAKLKSNQQYAANMYGKMGLGPGALQKYAEDIPLAIDRIGVAFDAIQMKIATVAIPVIERLSVALSNFVAGNADNIGGAIEAAARWIFVEAPVMLAEGVSAVASVVSGAVDGLISFGEKLATGLPQWLGAAADYTAAVLRRLSENITEAGNWIVEGIAGALEGIGRAVGGWITAFGGAINRLATDGSPLRSFAEMLAKLANGFSEMLSMASGAMEVLIATVQNAMEFLHHPFSPKYRDLGEAYEEGKAKSPAVDYLKPLKAYLDDASKSTAITDAGASFTRTAFDKAREFRKGGADFTKKAAGNVLSLADQIAPPGKPNIGVVAGEKLAKPVTTATDFARDNLKPVSDALKRQSDRLTQLVGTREERTREWQNAMLKANQEIAASTRKMVESGRGTDKSDRAAAYMMMRLAKESGGALLRMGG